MTIRWRWIKGYKDFYRVSDRGEIKSVARIIKKSGFERQIKTRILKQTKNKNGYWKVELHKDGKQSTCFVHHAVVDAFIGGRNGRKVEVDHIDQDKNNNKLSNFRLATHGQNNHNKKVRRDSASGVKGVYYEKRRNKWWAHIGFDKKLKWFGPYKYKSTAIRKRIKEANRLHKDFVSH